eukprot:5084925-Lingulodinium_polyedra.AAC.1
MFCTTCGLWVANLSQWGEHLRGRKHKRTTQARKSPAGGPPPPDIIENCRNVLRVIYIRPAV